jgi:translation initiation factor IF-3
LVSSGPRSCTISRRRFLMAGAGPVRRTRVNHMIRISPIRVIGANDEQIGIVETHEALRMAQEAGLDLVEISPEVRPPVCKIMDYGKYRYEQNKRPNRKSAQNEVKEIRLGRSVKIGEHDVQIRVDQARKFLMAGHKVQITQRFRGREMMHKELGIDRLQGIVEALADIAKLEMSPRWMGRQASVLLAPDRDRIKALKAKMSREERLAAEAAERAAIEAHAAEVDDDDDDDDDENEAQETVEKTRRGKQRDQRAINPVDDEMSDLLG